MLDLNVIRQRAATRASVANAANWLIQPPTSRASVASPANWLTQTEPDVQPISQLAKLASVASESRAPTTDRSCANCRHRSRYGTCLQPVAAGLAKRFSIRWPEPGHGANCAAWKRNPFEAQVLVHIEAARRGWNATERAAWMADADADPDAVLDVLASREVRDA